MPFKTIKEWEDYQVMCEARVFSRCPECKEDWDDCKCKDEQCSAIDVVEK